METETNSVTFEQIELFLYNIFYFASNDKNIINQDVVNTYEYIIESFLIQFINQQISTLIIDLFRLYVLSWNLNHTKDIMWLNFMGAKVKFATLNDIIEYIIELIIEDTSGDLK